VKQEGISLLQNPEDAGEWGYLATYGQQSLAGDTLGMAVLFRKNDLIEITEDTYNWVAVLKPVDGHLNYHFLAAWEQEPGGIKTEQQFKDYLKETIWKLNHPLKIVM
jgi:hypothetical protein